MLPMIAGKVAKKSWDRMTHQNERSQSSSGEYERKRGMGTPLKITCGLAAVALAGSAVAGVQRGFEYYQFIENEVTAEGGQAEIISFDADYEAKCWTATSIQVTGSGVKDEFKVAGVSMGWQTSMVDARYKQTFCIDSTTLNYEINQATGHVKINIPSKDDIKTKTEIELALGSIEPYGDQTPGYAFNNALVEMNESLPVIEDFPGAKNDASERDKSSSMRLNMGLILGAMTAKEQCQKETWELAAKPFENGVKRTVSVGLTVARALRPDANIDPANISVLVEGKPVTELDAPGDKSDIDEAFRQIEEYANTHDSLTILPPKTSGCEISDEVKNLPSQSDPVVKNVSEEGVRNG